MRSSCHATAERTRRQNRQWRCAYTRPANGTSIVEPTRPSPPSTRSSHHWVYTMKITHTRTHRTHRLGRADTRGMRPSAEACCRCRSNTVLFMVRVKSMLASFSRAWARLAQCCAIGNHGERGGGKATEDIMSSERVVTISYALLHAEIGGNNRATIRCQACLARFVRVHPMIRWRCPAPPPPPTSRLHLQRLGVDGGPNDPGALLCVQLGGVVRGHAVHVQVVPQQRRGLLAGPAINVDPRTTCVGNG